MILGTHAVKPLITALIFIILAMPTAYAGKKNDTMVISFTREILNLDYMHTTKREYIMLSDLIDETLFHIGSSSNFIKTTEFCFWIRT